MCVLNIEEQRVKVLDDECHWVDEIHITEVEAKVLALLSCNEPITIKEFYKFGYKESYIRNLILRLRNKGFNIWTTSKRGYRLDDEIYIE